jgi:acetyl esterase/lipase
MSLLSSRLVQAPSPGLFIVDKIYHGVHGPIGPAISPVDHGMVKGGRGAANAAHPSGRCLRRRGMRLLKLCRICLPALLLSACSPADLVNLLTPSGGYSVSRDIAYGPQARQRLDLYEPAAPAADGAMVVFFYGGSWDSGSKDDYLFAAQAFAAAGLRVAVPDYRLYPEVIYPDFLEDSAAAVAWARAQHDGPLVLVGHSAGAYNAVMLALDPRWLAGESLTPCRALAGVVGLAGPYDFLPLDDAELEAIFAPPEGRAATQPINHARAAAPPLLLLTGNEDRTVLPRNSLNLAAARRAAGGRAESRLYDGIDHIGIVGALSWPLRGTAPVLRDTLAFIAARAASDGPAC